MSDFQECQLNIGDCFLDCKIKGEGTPLLLIMGLWGNMGLWNEWVLDQLAQDYRVIIFDARGIGNSTRGTKKVSIEQYANDAARLLYLLKIPRAHVLGWSMGSFVAQELAHRFPEFVSSLILYGTACGGQNILCGNTEQYQKMLVTIPETFGGYKERWFNLMYPTDWVRENRAFLERFLNLKGRIISYQVQKEQLLALQKWHGSFEYLPSLCQQILVVGGKKDHVFSYHNFEMVAARSGNFSCCLCESGGHDLMNQKPRWFFKIIKDFLG